MKYLAPALLIAMSSFFGFSAQAEDGKEKPRYFIDDQIFTMPDDSDKYGSRFDSYDDALRASQQVVWRKIAADLDTPTKPRPKEPDRYGFAYSSSNCLYDLPFKVLRDIRKDSDHSDSYQKIWVENQNRVFSACDGRSDDSTSTAPVEPKGVDLPARAKSDFLYQLASWNFYRNEDDAAQALYEQVAADKTAPMRPYASYMLLRALNNPNNKKAAYAKAVEFLADPTLEPAFPLIQNYLFILGWGDSGPDPKAHLQWLLSVLKSPPERSANIQVALNNYSDAVQQLNVYFPRNNGELDWWLKDQPQESARMEAVRTMAPQSELVDWMQASWTENWFDGSWLWALHRQDNAYWAQNKHIVDHAWTRWKNGGGMEWLQIAARRVHPKDPSAADILAAMSSYFTKDEQSKFANHKTWLVDLWAQSIRIHLGRDEFNEALALVKDHREFVNFRGIIRKEGEERRSVVSISHRDTLTAAISWLYYTGHYDDARSMLAEAQLRYPYQFRFFRTLLGASWGRIVMVHQTSPDEINAKDNRNAENLWLAITNSLSTSELESLAAYEAPFQQITGNSYYSRTALVRAFLLNAGDKTLRDYAAMAAKRNPMLRDQLLNAFTTPDRYAFISFMVRNPRFRPTTQIYLRDSYSSFEQKLDFNFTSIDNQNPMDNNWWCAISADDLNSAVLEAAYVGPTDPYDYKYDYQYRTVTKTLNPEFQVYRDKQRAFLMQHPYREHIDDDETNKIAALGNGSKYLSEAVIAHVDSWRMMFFETEAERDKNASDLANAVRTTGLGCGAYSKQPYSRKAFQLLHKRYPDSIWAEATPYWY